MSNIDYMKETKRIYDEYGAPDRNEIIRTLNNLYDRGFTEEGIYYAIKKIDKKNGGIIQGIPLLYNSDYQNEINAIIERKEREEIEKERARQERIKARELGEERRKNRQVITIDKTKDNEKRKERYREAEREIGEIIAIYPEEPAGLRWDNTGKYREYIELKDKLDNRLLELRQIMNKNAIGGR